MIPTAEHAPLDASLLAGEHGTVTIRDHFWPAADGRHVTGITGRITIHPAKNVLGFDVNHRDANWIAEIQGEHDRIVLPGCAILGFHLHPPGDLNADYLQVE